MCSAAAVWVAKRHCQQKNCMLQLTYGYVSNSGSFLSKKHTHEHNTKHTHTQHNNITHNTTTPHTTQQHHTQHNTTRHNTAQHSTAQRSAAQHNTTQHNTHTHARAARHGTARHGTARHGTARHCPARHNTTRHDTHACTHLCPVCPHSARHRQTKMRSSRLQECVFFSRALSWRKSDCHAPRLGVADWPFTAPL